MPRATGTRHRTAAPSFHDLIWFKEFCLCVCVCSDPDMTTLVHSLESTMVVASARHARLPGHAEQNLVFRTGALDRKSRNQHKNFRAVRAHNKNSVHHLPRPSWLLSVYRPIIYANSGQAADQTALRDRRRIQHVAAPSASRHGQEPVNAEDGTSMFPASLPWTA